MADVITIKIIVLALIGGILPALVWLWFWLHEDSKHPEPRIALLVTFVAGMVTVILVLPLETYVHGLFVNSMAIVFILWAIIEELFKYGMAYFFALRKSFCDEPIDAVIYMLTTALGFAALENSLFLINPLSHSNILQSLIEDNMRFMGASLLHVLASATVGIFIAFSFYKNKQDRRLYVTIGLMLAIALHASFNLSIMMNSGNSFFIFALVWLAMSLLILLFEQIKRRYSFKQYVQKKQ